MLCFYTSKYTNSEEKNKSCIAIKHLDAVEQLFYNHIVAFWIESKQIIYNI